MKVFVKFFSEVNLGDDLFLKILFERYPDTQFFISANCKYKDIFKNYRNVNVIEENRITKGSLSKNFDKLYLLITKYLFPSLYVAKIKNNIYKQYKSIIDNHDVFLSIGGSIFMQKKILPTYGNIELYSLLVNSPIKLIIIGCNFGPYITSKYRDAFKNIFAKAHDVCFRDTVSYNLFNELQNIRYSPDVVYNLNLSKSQKIVNSVGFSIIAPLKGMNHNSYINKFRELIESYLGKNYKVFLFSFCNKQGDNKIIDEIISPFYQNENIHTVYYNGNINNFLKEYSSVERMFCCRFHSMILSMLYGQKIYPIIYSDKMTYVLNDISYNGQYVKIQDFHAQDVRELIQDIDQNCYDISNEILESVGQFKTLDELLRSNFI